MKSYIDQFPVLANYTYLNTASSGVLPVTVKNWRAEHDTEFSQHASIFREPHKDHIEQIRSTVARFCGAFEDDVALIPNWSIGFNTLLEGFEIPLKCLLLKGDYPSINWPAENHDFECYYATIDYKIEENIEASLAKHKPDVFAFSMTQYISGISLSMDFLRKIKKQYPEMLLIADGTQYLGTRPFDFNKSPLDIFGASGYKWLMAGYAAGCMLIKQTAKKRLFPKTIGFNSASYLFSNREQVPFNKLLEPGHHDTLNFGSLMRSIQLLEKEGLQAIFEKIKSIRSYAIDKLIEVESLDAAIKNREDNSPILSLISLPRLYEHLYKNGIICSERGSGIRISFHFYNSKKDIDTLVEAIKKFKN